jgi:hypothetical protein
MAATTVRNSPPLGPEPWQVTGCSVLGASHRRKGTENQDHIKYHDERGRAIVALADGHGSAKSFRSAKGSEFAVTVSYGFAWELLRAAPGGGDRFLSFVKDQVETDIPRRIVHGWSKIRLRSRSLLFSKNRTARRAGGASNRTAGWPTDRR